MNTVAPQPERTPTFGDRSSPTANDPPLSPDVASFYHLPEGPAIGQRCAGTACWVAGQGRPETRSGSSDNAPRIHCLGHCFASPAVAGTQRQPHLAADVPVPIVLERLVHGGARSLDAYQRSGGYHAFQHCRGRAPEEILSALDVSELRGRGGAGFPVGRKWRAAHVATGTPKHIIANADEGDPGAYVDRILLESDPHGVLEGLLLGARAVGASHGWIYLRNEYPAAFRSLQQALAEARGAGFLGPDALGPGRPFDITVHVGRGSYACGEETALIHSLEGRRPEVTARPPYATERGAWGQPTVVNNVETLANVPWILRHGGEAYRTRGFSRSRGTKVLSLNSLFRRPGLYEVEFGVSLRHVVEDLGGGLRAGSELKGLFLGGPLASLLPPRLLDTPLGFEELHAVGANLGHGGVIAFDQHTSILALLHHVFAFAAYESCGKCTPCREGSQRITDLLAGQVGSGRLSPEAGARCRRVIDALQWTSLCGLGSGLAEFAASAFRHYGEELSA